MAKNKLIWNSKSPINYRDIVFFGGGEYPKLGNKYTDSSIRRNHGTLMPNAATGPQWTWDDYLQRWSLDLMTGRLRYVLIPDVLGGRTVFSFAVWVNTVRTNQDGDILVGGGHYGGEPFVLWYDNAATDHYAFLVTDTGGTTSGAKYSAVKAANNRWQHLAVSFAPGSLRMWIDGVEDANSPFSIAGVDDVSSEVVSGTYLGWNSLFTNSQRLSGFLADPLVVNSALSPAQIAWHANPTNHLLVPRRRWLPVATITTIPSDKHIYLYISKRRRSLYLRNFR